MGFDASVISGVVKFIEPRFELTKIQLGWAVSSLTLTATLAMMLAARDPSVEVRDGLDLDSAVPPDPVVEGQSATGSLVEEIRRGHLVVCDQIIDKTHGRESTFFDRGIVAQPIPIAVVGFENQTGDPAYEERAREVIAALRQLSPLQAG